MHEDAAMTVSSMIKPERGMGLTLVPFGDDVELPSHDIALHFAQIYRDRPMIRWLSHQLDQTIRELATDGSP